MSENEASLLVITQRFKTLASGKEKELQELANLIAGICGTPMAFITFLDHDTLYFRNQFNADLQSVKGKETFSHYVVQQKGVMMVPDTWSDERFQDNLFVKDNPYIRFYAGAPLITQSGQSIGSLCVVSTEVMELNISQQQTLKLFAQQVIYLLEFDLDLLRLKEQYLRAVEAETRLRSFFEHTSSLHVLIGKELEVLVFNAAAAAFVRRAYQIELTEGMRASNFFQESYISDFAENYKKALSGITVQTRRKLSFAFGTVCWHLSYDPAYDPKGELIGVTFHVTDVTEKQLQILPN